MFLIMHLLTSIYSRWVVSGTMMWIELLQSITSLKASWVNVGKYLPLYCYILQTNKQYDYLFV